MKRDSFTFKKEWRDAICELPEKVREEVYVAIIEYGITGETPQLKPMARMAFAFVKADMDNMRKTSKAEKTGSGNTRRGAPVGNHNASKHKQDEQPPKQELPSKPSPTPSDPVSAPYADALRQSSQSKDPPVYREVTEIAQDQAWIESVCMLLHLQPDNLAPYFSLFRTECVSQGKHSHINLQDCKSHFTNWLRKQIEKRQKNEQSEKQRSLRRRNDVPDAGKTNYHSSL